MNEFFIRTRKSWLQKHEYVCCLNLINNDELKSFLFFFFLFFLEIAALNHKFSSVTLYRNKTVKYSARMHAIIACQMEFQLYPMDIQICPIYIESCKFNDETRLANI